MAAFDQSQDSERLKGLKYKKIVFAGNPNVGKSVFFNKFTGTYVEVSNYPGTTVDVSTITIDNHEIIDTPGIYGIGNYNDEEIVAKEFILQADKIVNVVNALNLERDLFLTQQLIDLGIPMVIALNQIDEASSRGLKIDIERLEESLGVTVIPTIAIKNKGISDVKKFIFEAEIKCSEKLTPSIKKLIETTQKQDFSRILQVLKQEENLEDREKIYAERREIIDKVVENCVSETNEGTNLSTKIGRWLLNPFVGSLSAIMTLFLLYQLIGVFVAGDIVNLIESKLVSKYYIPWVSDLVNNFISSEILKEYLSGEFGILTMAIHYIFGVLLPLIAAFHLFMAILEDSGYLPRVAALTDRFLSKIGLNGRAVIPIILGFGCITMATITTRILGSSRERTIATALLGLTIPCSAQLGLIIALLAAIGGLKAWIIYLVSIAIVFITVGTLLNKYLPGKSSYLIIDLPTMKFPQPKNILMKTYSKSIHFLQEAAPLFVIGSLIITTLNLTNGMQFIEKTFAPFASNILNLPQETATIFIMGIIRRDFAAAGLAKMSGLDGSASVLSPEQILTGLVVLTLFVPCIIAVTVLFKERGFKEACLIWFGSIFVAFSAGGILSRLLTFIF